MEKPEIIAVLKQHITHEIMKAPHLQIEADTSLFSSDLLSSLSIAQIGVFIEIHFNLYIPDPELVPENLDTLSDIADLILRKLADED